MDLKYRFKTETLTSFGISSLMNLMLDKLKDKKRTPELRESFDKILNQYGNLLPDSTSASEVKFHGEVALWKTMWLQADIGTESVPGTAIDALNACEVELFPIIHTFLTVLASLPVSVATAASLH